MKTNYFVLDEATKKTYGPFFDYKIAALVADRVDNNCGQSACTIKMLLKSGLVTIPRTTSTNNYSL